MRKKLLIYLTLGYPSIDRQITFLQNLPDDTIDGVELGLPSPDPRYDGPKIRSTHNASISLSELSGVFEACRSLKLHVNVLAYYSDLKGSLDKVSSFLSEHSVNEIIAPDLLIDYPSTAENDILSLKAAGLSYIPFFNAATPDSVIKRILNLSESWIYYGLQPSTGINMPFDLDAVVERATSLISDRDLIFGFGIKDRDDIPRILSHGGSGVAIGSALVDPLGSGNFELAYDMIRKYRGALDSVV